MDMDGAIVRLYHTALQRRDQPVEGSYTRYLYDMGLDKILKKVGEECAETIIAAKNNSKPELVGEMCDLFYHLTILMVQQGISPEDIAEELERRARKSGNLKKMRETDTNT